MIASSLCSFRDWKGAFPPFAVDPVGELDVGRNLTSAVRECQAYLAKMRNHLAFKSDTLLRMVRRSPRNVEQLAAYLRQAMKRKDVNASQIAMRASRSGFKITREYVRLILNQEAKNLTIDKLEALAIGLDEPFESVLFAAAGLNRQTKDSFKESVLYKLYVKSEDPRTPPEERALIAALAEMVADHLRRKGLG